MQRRVHSFGMAAMSSLAFVLAACGPSIKSFTADAITVTSKDSVRFNWDITGTPTLLFHEEPVTDSLEPHYLEFKLVVKKGKDEVSRPIEIIVLPKQSSNLIVFSTTLSGDTLVAADEKNPERWGNRFEIQSIASACNRKLTVSHAAINAEVDELGTLTTAFAGTPVEGPWSFKSLMTEAEKADHTLAPETLRIKINIQRKTQ